MVATRFDPADIGRMRSYADGDGDGVLEADITAGIDYPTGPETRLADHFGTAALRIAFDVPDPGGGGTLLAGSDPIRLGASNLLSFSPFGTATSGTIYLSSADDTQLCVRVLGTTGRVRVLWFDRRSLEWRND
jgi:hypothetical protein